MGSTPSRTRVMSMQLQVARERDGRDFTATSPQQARAQEENDLRERVEGLEALLLECQERMDEAEERAKAAESQVEVLQQQLKNYISKENTPEPKDHHSATVKAQGQFIKKLEIELAEAKQEMLQTRERYERKLQKVRVSSAKSQAKSALTMFELRDENTKLLEENARLLEEVSHNQAEKEALSHHCTSDSNRSERGSGSDERKESGSDRDGHMRLIMELSQQVSSLDAELRQAQETIQKLRREQQSHNGEWSSLSPSSGHSTASYTGRVSVGNSKHSLFEEPEEEV